MDGWIWSVTALCLSPYDWLLIKSQEGAQATADTLGDRLKLYAARYAVRVCRMLHANSVCCVLCSYARATWIGIKPTRRVFIGACRYSISLFFLILFLIFTSNKVQTERVEPREYFRVQFKLDTLYCSIRISKTFNRWNCIRYNSVQSYNSNWANLVW